MEKYVIIGNSAAAIGCIEGIRSVDGEGGIAVISKETQHTYSRPLISYLLQGKIDRQKMKYRPDGFYESMKCEAFFGAAVTAIDNAGKKVITESGLEIPYGKLMVAAGSRPFVPPFKGLDTVKEKYTFMSLDDANALEKALTGNSRVLIIGAGLIGLKCAEGIYARAGEITVVDIADKVLPSIMDEQGALIVQRHIEEKGIKFILKDGVAEFKGNTAVLNSGKTLDFDILIIAVGVRPNTELVKNIGGTVNRGIIVDAGCKTSLEGIYAGGDCVESADITSGESRILAILPNAYMQGYCAGVNMAGGSKKFEKATAMNAIGFFGLHIVTAGNYNGEAFIKSGSGEYKKLVYKDNKLKGYIIIGDIARAGIYTALIREQTPLDSIDFDLIKEKPQLMAFKRTDRARILGEVRI